MTDNKITTLNPDHLQGTKALTELDLSGNLLTVFPDLGDAKETLKTVKLTGNLIASVPPQSLIGYKQLTHILDITTNQMVEFPNPCKQDMWSGMTYLHGDPKYLFCDCKVQHILVSPDPTGHFQFWSCSSPSNLAGQKVKSLSLAQLKCGGKGIFLNQVL